MRDDKTKPQAIELRLSRLAQLFNSFDPSPFHDRDLDDDAEQYIVGWARELPRDAPLRLRLHLPREEADACDLGDVSTALHRYFSDRAEATRMELSELFRIGRTYLLLGAPVLALCLTASQLLGASLPSGPVREIVTESLIILGWVANWRPIETFLYDWQPVRRQLRLYQRLSRAAVELVRS
jgi:hypothetical protein